jgi:trimeric autotransporter adhesin
MKKSSLFISFFILIFSITLKAQIQQSCGGNVGIGSTNLIARFNIQPQLSEPGATNLLIGNWNSSQGCISIGVHSNYSWIQTWNNRPLYINRQGNDVIFCNQFTWGNVGIGYNITTPSAKLHVNGSIYATGTITSSDMRMKKNINKLELNKDITEKIKKIKPITYEWDIDKEIDQTIDSLSAIDKAFYERKQYGFSAQEVQKVFPELVYEDNTGKLGVNYQGFIPILYKMVDSLQTTIESMRSEIQELKKGSGSNKLKSASSLTENLTKLDNSTSSLYQNAPNPFSISTTIEYTLAENVQKAMICIYDMNGTQLKCIPLHLSGYGNITINGSELKAGMYMYSLIADGHLVDTKRMVLTD